MASTLASLLPQSEGWLPSWLLFVRPQNRLNQPNPSLTSFLSDLPSLHLQHRPILHLHNPHRARLQPQPTLLLLHPSNRAATHASHPADRPPLRHLDAPRRRHPPLRRLLYQRQTCLRARHGGVCRRMGPFHERVVGFWDYQVGRPNCGTGIY